MVCSGQGLLLNRHEGQDQTCLGQRGGETTGIVLAPLGKPSCAPPPSPNQTPFGFIPGKWKVLWIRQLIETSSCGSDSTITKLTTATESFHWNKYRILFSLYYAPTLSHSYF